MLAVQNLVLVCVLLGLRSVVSLSKGSRSKEICPEVCEPEKCPNVGPIGLSQCPAEQYIVTYRCGCCKKCDVRPVTTTISPKRRDEVCKLMTCPKKKVCVLNIQGLPVCKCPTDDLCKKFVNRGVGKKVKVCGSDGITYPSRCHLKVASCASDGKIRVVKKGACAAAVTTSELSTRPTSTTSGRNRGGGRNGGRAGKKHHAHNHSKGGHKRQHRRGEKRQNKRQNRKRDKNYQRALRSLKSQRKNFKDN